MGHMEMDETSRKLSMVENNSVRRFYSAPLDFGIRHKNPIFH